MVDIAVLQEVKITDPKFAARKWAGYKILTAAAGTANCGGIALLVKEKDGGSFSFENAKVIGTNVISCELVTGQYKSWLIVGCYLPTSDTEGVTHRMVINALENRPAGMCPVVIGDLNPDLVFPRDRQEEILSSAMSGMDLMCASNGNRVRKKRKKTYGNWTFQRYKNRGGGGRTWIHSKPDYFLIRQ